MGDLQAFAKDVKAWVAEGKSSVPWDELTVQEVSQEYVRQAHVTPQRRSYKEAISCSPCSPQVFIDETFDDRFSSLMAGIDWFIEAMKLPEQTTLFITLLCMNQHDSSDFSDWDDNLQILIDDCEAWFSMLPDRRDLIIRSNRMMQLQLCFKRDTPIYFGCSQGVLACTAPFPDSSWQFGHFDADIAQIIVDANWEEAECKDPDVKERYKK